MTSLPPATLVIIDLTHRFSPSHLLPALSVEELRHIHVFRATKGNLAATVAEVERYMVGGRHGSGWRVWRGSVVLGGSVPAGGLGDGLLVSTGWRGWLRVEREEVGGFGLGGSVEEAWGGEGREMES
ncbi:hypothetical protein GLAREA_03632 [Glarea lozoyensis ATCC 20868]|uniref:Uncharacterized protein n=1 Tax=Glarea lozoyensis (strain ATCC 20868 / MF5171) TaxID=1116229 RepID=S3CYI6_GLAL2|nr:uncharacterized protein GLAREA_03632 [Glarea lozoyensis ATCC 20868]EPE30665.1 hypothetical protein GLAREA_03632 [Glarea lozoyensis ATCC 20868]